MKKGFKIAGIALGIILVFFAILVVWQWDTVRFVLDNYDTLQEGNEWVADLEEPEDLLDYMEAHKDKFSFRVIKLNDTEKELSWRADSMQPVASTYKILVLAEVARQIEEGELDPDQMVPVDEVRAFYLPRTDGEAHQEAFRQFEADGLIHQENVALREVIRAMIRWSDNAATDYLIHQVGRENLEDLTAKLDYEHLEVPYPINGAYLLWQNHELEDPPEERLADYRQMQRGELIDKMYAASRRMNEDEEFRQTEQSRLEESRLGLGLKMQRVYTQATTPLGTAGNYTEILHSVFLGDFISPEVSGRMQEFLEWPMTNERIQRDFSQFGSKGGSLPAVFTSASYGRPHDGDPIIAAVFFQDLHFAVWFHLMQQHLHHEFELQLMKNEDFWEEVESRVEAWHQ